MDNKLSMWFILEPLIYSQEFTHLADLSRKLNMHHATLRKYLNRLEKLGVLVKQIKGRLTMYRLNYANPLIVDYIQTVEKEKLLNKCQNDLLLKEVVSSIHEDPERNNILIFGSAAEDIKKANDIDLLIIGESKIKDRLKLLEKRLNLKLHIINAKKLGEINKPLKNEIINKHIIIEGLEAFTRWMIKN